MSVLSSGSFVRSDAGAASTSYGQPITIAAGTDRRLLLMCVAGRFLCDTQSTPTYNGVAMTLAGDTAPGGGGTSQSAARAVCWEMTNPPVGTANFAVTNPSNTNEGVWYYLVIDESVGSSSSAFIDAGPSVPITSAVPSASVGSGKLGFIAGSSISYSGGGVLAGSTGVGVVIAGFCAGYREGANPGLGTWPSNQAAALTVAVPMGVAGPVITGPSGSAGAGSSTANLAENATTGPTFTTDASLGGGFPTLTGTDASLFTIAALSSTSWRVNPVSAFNFESLPHSNPFNITFNASASVSQTCAITVTNVNEAPTFSGTISVPTLTQLTGMSAINVASLFADPDSGDTGTYSTIGSWPSGVTVNASGVISGTPVVSGTFSNLRVRRTDGGGLTGDSNLFTITITASAGSVTTEPLENSNGSLCASVTVHYSWYPNGRIGSLAGITPQEGSATTNASGQLTATGLIAGPGVLFTDYRQVSQTNDVVHYHVLTAA